MATVTASQGALDTRHLGLSIDGSIDIASLSNSHIRFLFDAIDYIDFYGVFDLNPGGTGTISEIRNTVGAVATLDVTDANADATTLFGLIQAGSGAEAYLFREGDTLDGAAERDTLFGFGGRDTLHGAGGDDRISGGGGADLIVGGEGKDSLRGGGGADVFAYDFATESGRAGADRDTILDFSHAQRDKIDLSAIDANARTSGVNEAFSVVSAFDGHAGELVIKAVAAGWLVQGDTDGHGGADFAILVKSADGPIVATDFHL